MASPQGVQHRPDRHVNPGRGGGLKPQPSGQAGQLGADQRWLIGANPPHEVIVGAVPVCVLDGQCGLSDSAHPLQGPRGQDRRDGAGRSLPEALPEPDEDLFPAREVPVALRDVTPDDWNVSRCLRW